MLELSELLNEHIEVMRGSMTLNNTALRVVGRLLRQQLDMGHCVFACGNGGSAADAQHFVAELVGRFEINRAPLRAIALTTDTSILTAVGNDYGFEDVFARQVDALVRVGDVLLCISTSGESENVCRAAALAKRRGAHVVGLTGEMGGRLAEVCDVVICSASARTARAQEFHCFALHALCALVDDVPA